jgi:hypothetical protein
MTMSAASKISPGVSIDPGPGLEVGLVGKAAAGTGAFLHQHRVAVVDHHLHPAGVMHTRFSSVLISFRMPTIMVPPFPIRF